MTENTEMQFDLIYDVKAGIQVVGKNRKYNILSNGNLLFDEWLDGIDDYNHGFASVERNGKWNFIDKNGNLLSVKWFDGVCDFSDGFARVELDNKWNYLTKKGTLLSSMWFDKVAPFNDGFSMKREFANVWFNHKRYKIDKKGNITE